MIAPLTMPLIASPATIAALSLGVEPIPRSGHRRAFGAIFARLGAVVLLVAAVAPIVDGVRAV